MTEPTKEPTILIEITVNEAAYALAFLMLKCKRTAVNVELDNELYTISIDGTLVLKKKDPQFNLENFIKEGWAHE